MDIEQLLAGALGGDTVKNIAGQLGVDPQMAQSAIQMAAPMLIKAVGNHAANDAQGVHHALDNGDHEGLLGMVFGQQQHDKLAQKTGMDSNMIGQLMGVVGPMLLGQMNQQRQSQGLDLTSLLGSLLGGGGQQQGGGAASGLMGMLGGVADQDGDGDFDLGDAMKLAGGLMGGKK